MRRARRKGRATNLGRTLAALALGSCAAAPAQVEVATSVATPRPEPVAKEPPGLVPLDHGPVRVDGELDEWASAPSAAPLDPVRGGGPAPEARLRARVAPEGLAVAVDRLPEEATSTLLLDPNGLGQTWWTVRLGPGGATWSECGGPAPEIAVPARIGWNALPCRPAEGFPAAHGEGWEVLFPWRLGTTATAHLGWSVQGDRSGTWDIAGAPEPAPGGRGRMLETRTRRPVVRIGFARNGDPLLEVGADPGTRWTWRAWWNGAVRAKGALEVGRSGHASVPLPEEPLPGGLVEVVAETGDTLPGAGIAWLPSDPPAATLGTPVFTDRIEIAWRSDRPLIVPLEIRARGGRLLHAEEVALQPGSGLVTVEVPPSWPDRLRIELGDLLPRDALAVRVRE